MPWRCLGLGRSLCGRLGCGWFVPKAVEFAAALLGETVQLLVGQPLRRL